MGAAVHSPDDGFKLFNREAHRFPLPSCRRKPSKDQHHNTMYAGLAGDQSPTGAGAGLFWFFQQ